jgi:CubicO group peptidase (beta-lactamase class C family)
MIVQQLLEDVAGEPFAEIMHDVVLEKWGMTDSTFESPLPEDLWSIAAAGHRPDGSTIAGGWHTYPEMGSGASMWATPSDLANFAIGVMLSYTGQPDGVLSKDMAIEMLTPQIENRGLGPVVIDEGGDLFYFLHPGANEGYRDYLLAYPKRGQGVIIMTNGDNGEALLDEIKRSLSIEYGLVRDNTNLYVGITVAILLALLGFLLLRRIRARRFSA